MAGGFVWCIEVCRQVDANVHIECMNVGLSTIREMLGAALAISFQRGAEQLLHSIEFHIIGGEME